MRTNWFSILRSLSMLVVVVSCFGNETSHSELYNAISVALSGELRAPHLGENEVERLRRLITSNPEAANNVLEEVLDYDQVKANISQVDLKSVLRLTSGDGVGSLRILAKYAPQIEAALVRARSESDPNKRSGAINLLQACCSDVIESYKALPPGIMAGGSAAVSKSILTRMEAEAGNLRDAVYIALGGRTTRESVKSLIEKNPAEAIRIVSEDMDRDGLVQWIDGYTVHGVVQWTTVDKAGSKEVLDRYKRLLETALTEARETLGKTKRDDRILKSKMDLLTVYLNKVTKIESELSGKNAASNEIATEAENRAAVETRKNVNVPLEQSKPAVLPEGQSTLNPVSRKVFWLSVLGAGTLVITFSLRYLLRQARRNDERDKL